MTINEDQIIATVLFEQSPKNLLNCFTERNDKEIRPHASLASLITASKMCPSFRSPFHIPLHLKILS
jgi:hypothetical protein